jgi:hypothetical protein
VVADEKPRFLRVFKDLVGAFCASTGPAASTGRMRRARSAPRHWTSESHFPRNPRAARDFGQKTWVLSPVLPTNSAEDPENGLFVDLSVAVLTSCKRDAAP